MGAAHAITHVITHAIIHYAEIGIKGSNRREFEQFLSQNIKKKLGSRAGLLKREYGRIIVDLAKDADPEELKDILSRIPGIACFYLCTSAELEEDAIGAAVRSILKDKDFSTFRITTRRSNKRFPVQSTKMNENLGGVVIDAYKKKVKLVDPDITVLVEIAEKAAYISLDEFKGVGGLPTDPSNRVVALLSGGFDSPVAAYLMMKRGCEVRFVHFQNENQETCSVKSKIVDLAQQLSRYQVYTRLFIVPFGMIQREIIMKVESKMRMLVYRRFMLKIAAAIAKKEKAKFLVVGDSFSQVASQTLENLEATYKGSPMHVLSPVIGADKSEIVDISRKIGTYDISKQPYGDCCSYFLPKHPVLNATPELLDEAEKEFDVDDLVKKAVDAAQVQEF